MMTDKGVTRRRFLRTGAIGLAAVTTPLDVVLSPHITTHPSRNALLGGADLKALIQRAIDAALSAGASYADVRVTHDRIRDFPSPPTPVVDAESIGIGVRALADGYWGFASSATLTPEEMVRLGQEAAFQATTNSLGISLERELAPGQVVSNGHWKTPIKINPFDVPFAEISDFLQSLKIYTQRMPKSAIRGNGARFSLQTKSFGSSIGSYCTQECFLSSGALAVSRSNKTGTETLTQVVPGLTPASLGWELFTEQNLREKIQKTLHDLEFELSLPVKPVEVGRYNAVLDASSVSELLRHTIGTATELDRAMGFEANGDGTSYITVPATMLGTLRIGPPLLNVTADRSAVGGAATVQWDDDGVVPDDFELIKGGILEDFSTTRESTTWLHNQYTALARPIRSHGCAAAESALFAPTTLTPNLKMAPGEASLDFDELLQTAGSGIAFRNATSSMDFQQLNGLAFGRGYEIKAGKLVSRIANAGILFNTPELWKSISVLGGSNSMQRHGMRSAKGQPPQWTYCSVTGVPVICQSVSIIDILRKA